MVRNPYVLCFRRREIGLIASSRALLLVAAESGYFSSCCVTTMYPSAALRPYRDSSLNETASSQALNKFELYCPDVRTATQWSRLRMNRIVLCASCNRISLDM